MKNVHADDATLLRYATADLAGREAASVRRHVSGCEECRRGVDFATRLDRTLRSKRPELHEVLLGEGSLPATDPFAVRPSPVRALARNLQLDAKKLAREAAKASEAAGAKRDRLLKVARIGGTLLEQALRALRLDVLSDRFALSYLLEEAREIASDLPEDGRELANAGLDCLSTKRSDLRNGETGATEHVLPLADLFGLAHLLAGVGEVRRGAYEAASRCLLDSWRSFGEGRAAQYRLAAVELYESECRSIVGKPMEGLVLADRAARTFAEYGLKRDGVRAQGARGIALRCIGRVAESLKVFHVALAGFGKLRMWEEYADCLGSAVACSAALGKRKDIAKLCREAPRASMRLGSRYSFDWLSIVTLGRPRRTFEEIYRLSRAANEPAAAIVAAAKTSVEEAEKVIRTLDGDPRRSFALLYAAQKGCVVVPAEPVRMLELSGLLLEEAGSLLDFKLDSRTPTSRELVQAEAALLEAYSHLQLGHYAQATEATEKARLFFEEGGDAGLGRALCDYYGGNAAFFARNFGAGEKLLKRALKLFSEFGQDHLVAWAQGALGTLLATKGNYERGLQYLDVSAEAVDERKEPQKLAAIQLNRGSALSRMDRFDEARGAYARALMIARRCELKSLVPFIRNGLADLDFRRGQHQRALNAFSVLANDALVAGYDVDHVFARLYVAECLGRLGFAERMADEVTSLRQDKKAHPFAASPAMEELFACLDQGSIDAELVGHVRQYLEDTENGIQRPYRRLRLVG